MFRSQLRGDEVQLYFVSKPVTVTNFESAWFDARERIQNIASRADA